MALPMSEWDNCSSPSSASPDSDLPLPIRIMGGGSGAGRVVSEKKAILLTDYLRVLPCED
jgi:hypothetical protein